MSEILREQMHNEVEGSTPDSAAPERAIVFSGGIGYDQLRNQEVGNAILQLANYSQAIAIPDLPPSTPKDGLVVHRYADGSEREIPGKIALKQIDEDTAEVRFTRLHEERAKRLIEIIEAAGGKPVDAVFQSVDVSTGLLAMSERPELFKRVVLLDPSSLINLPSRGQYIKEEWQSRNLLQLIKRRPSRDESDQFEPPVSRLEKIKRRKRSNHSGNLIASYVSSQANMLHEIAESDNAPDLSIIASQFDHAYNPIRILHSLVNLDDVKGFFVTNMRHGLAGKRDRLEQVVDVLTQTKGKTGSFIERLHFFDGVSESYRRKIFDTINQRLN